jgi:hypothetical protein
MMSIRPDPDPLVFIQQVQSLRKKTYPADEVRPRDWSQAYLQSPYHLSKANKYGYVNKIVNTVAGT